MPSMTFPHETLVCVCDQESREKKRNIPLLSLAMTNAANDEWIKKGGGTRRRKWGTWTQSLLWLS
jgi:hypothetical protein